MNHFNIMQLQSVNEDTWKLRYFDENPSNIECEQGKNPLNICRDIKTKMKNVKIKNHGDKISKKLSKFFGESKHNYSIIKKFIDLKHVFNFLFTEKISQICKSDLDAIKIISTGFSKNQRKMISKKASKILF